MEPIMFFKHPVKSSLSGLVLSAVIWFGQVNQLMADVYFGLDGGFAQADLKAEQTAQRLATLSGSTVTYSYDKSTGYLRGYVGFPVVENIFIEGGYFNTGSLDATYTISGSSATESYDASGFDLMAVYRGGDLKKGGFYGRGGLHFSELSGAATVTIGGTTYNIASMSASGTGGVLGLGYELEKNAEGAGIRLGVDAYTGIGGLDDADFTLFYIGYMF
jgi:hypothetical protein